MEVLETTYFELNALEMLHKAGLNKSAFAEKLGVAAQNVNKTIATKNVFTLIRISKLLGVSLEMIITGESNNNKNALCCPNCGAKLQLVEVKE